MEIKINSKHGERKVGFGGMGATPLKDWPQDKLADLAILAHKSQDPSILELFEGELPHLEQLETEKTARDAAKAKASSSKPASVPSPSGSSPAGISKPVEQPK